MLYGFDELYSNISTDNAMERAMPTHLPWEMTSAKKDIRPVPREISQMIVRLNVPIQIIKSLVLTL